MAARSDRGQVVRRATGVPGPEALVGKLVFVDLERRRLRLAEGEFA